ELYVVDVAHGDALVRSSCALDVERLVGVGEAGGDLCRPILVGETAGLCEDRCHGRLDRGGDLAVAEAGQRQRGRLGRGGEVDVGDLPGRVLGDDAFIVLGDLHQVEGRDRVCAVTHRDLGSLRLADRGPGEGCGDAAIAGGEGGEHRRGCERGEVPGPGRLVGVAAVGGEEVRGDLLDARGEVGGGAGILAPGRRFPGGGGGTGGRAGSGAGGIGAEGVLSPA